MKRLFIIVVSALFVICGIKSPVSAEENCRAYVLIEADSLTVLDGENYDSEMNVGYLAKLMSLLLVAEDIETGKYSLNTVLTASQAVTGTKGSVIWLEQGDKLSVDELLKSVIIGNANDAVIVLAERSEGSVDAFVSRMNSEAFDLGLRHSAFYSPCGFFDEREYSTAHDIAVICARLSKYEFMLDYFKIWRDFVKEGQTELVNENTLSRTYKPHIGFKACHSDASGFCVAEAGRNENQTICIAVVLGCEDEETSLPMAKNLVKKGFTEFKVTASGFNDEFLRPIKVRDGVESAVEITLKSERSAVVPKAVKELSSRIIIPEYLDAPVYEGQSVGTAAFYNGDTLVFETEIIVKNDVDKLSLGYILRKFLLNIADK